MADIGKDKVKIDKAISVKNFFIIFVYGCNYKFKQNNLIFD